MINKISEIYQVNILYNNSFQVKTYSSEFNNNIKQKAIECFNYWSERADYVSLVLTIFVKNDDKFEKRNDILILEVNNEGKADK